MLPNVDDDKSYIANVKRNIPNLWYGNNLRVKKSLMTVKWNLENYIDFSFYLKDISHDV